MPAAGPHALPASLWAATATPAPPYSTAGGDIAADVAIVGAGYTGLSAALHLSQAGKKVVVVEASEPGWGASGRNGGQIIAGLKHDPDKLEAKFGQALGTAITRTIGGAADLVFDIIEKYGIDCHARRSGWIQGAHGVRAFEEIVTPRFRQWHARGVGARLLDRQAMATLTGSSPNAYHGGWFDPRGGVLQPLGYARGLAAAAMSQGATILANAPVLRLSSTDKGWTLNLGQGSVRARKVILATNAYTGDLWPGLRQTVIPVTSFQIATHPLAPAVRSTILPGGQGVADTRRLLLYFRLDHEGRLIMGGRSPVDDNPTMDDARTLKAALARIFPLAAGSPIEFVWSGKVAITKDTMPHIHILAPGLLTALGCNGRGVATCTAIGKLLSALATGTEPADLPFPVTAPNPYALHALRKVGVFAVSQYYRLLDSQSAT
ncbi:NAD(P)/FAD-dependent oxidoreductase [Mesorhizobium shangrilense]|uniref:FAD-dependent oxidoreductase n=1 Tax=Mesorhizobium shangrilense TaxID=460060 RepID=A0ABV2DJ13_9HYPH